jgi:hypothetical protein
VWRINKFFQAFPCQFLSPTCRNRKINNYFTPWSLVYASLIRVNFSWHYPHNPTKPIMYLYHTRMLIYSIMWLFSSSKWSHLAVDIFSPPPPSSDHICPHRVSSFFLTCKNKNNVCQTLKNQFTNVFRWQYSRSRFDITLRRPSCQFEFGLKWLGWRKQYYKNLMVKKNLLLHLHF